MDEHRKRGPGSRGSSHPSKDYQPNQEIKQSSQGENVNDRQITNNEKQKTESKEFQKNDKKTLKKSGDYSKDTKYKKNRNNSYSKSKNRNQRMNYYKEITKLKSDYQKFDNLIMKISKSKHDVKPLIFSLISIILSLIALLISTLAYMQ